MQCYSCENELTEKNSSNEHILLNSIGGKLKSKSLLCKKCNSDFGKNFDNILSQQLLFLSTFLNVERDRGSHPTLRGAKTKNGEEIHLLSGGKPYYSKPIVEEITKDNQVIINIKARNDRELNQIAKGLNRKYPRIAVDDIIKNAVHTYGYLNEPITVNQTIGGEKALNGITKIALNYFIHIHTIFTEVKQTIEILKFEKQNSLCKHYHIEKFYKKEPKEICHLIHVESSKRNKNLVAYVEFFSSFSFLIMLSDSYEGKPIRSTYCYDVNHKKELKKNIKINITTKDFQDLPIISPRYYNLITEKMDRIVKIGIEKQQSKELKELISRCVDEVFIKRYGYEKRITEEMIKEVSNLLSVEFIKFFYIKK
ncbi:HNH endonuclease [Chryseobacterium oranimense]|uniref:HNH endonuclease n=1 Tax=Chryseobacterium oranimense TaxID=421058 RepID=UPI002235AB63|nr:HNH endonuclease [Chryseobacterium oranimense]